MIWIIAISVALFALTLQAGLSGIFAMIADKYGIRPGVLESIAEQESAFNPDAIGTSGEIGIMQVLGSTARAVGLDPATLTTPTAQVEAGARVLAEAHSRYDGLDLIAAYNSGAARKNAKGQYVNSDGKTTVQAYVTAVSMKMMNRGINPITESLFV